MKKIRVGLIRCDSHGAYFGAMMGRHDPLKLRDPIERGTPPKKTWQAGGVHFYFYTSYWQPTLMTVPFAEGFEITRFEEWHLENLPDERDQAPANKDQPMGSGHAAGTPE